jgi:hypothetical protein
MLIRLGLAAQSSAGNFDLIWLFEQATKARVCTRAFVELVEPFGPGPRG